MTNDMRLARELVRLIEENPDLPVIVLNRQGDEHRPELYCEDENARAPYWHGDIRSVDVDTYLDDEDGEWSIWQGDRDWREELECRLDMPEDDTPEEEIAALPWKRAIAVRVGIR